jgi:anti-sigma regulatory factor (Ser/Thr protein kinase)
MEMNFTELVLVTDLSSVGEVRRTALLLAQRLGFDETRAGEVALLATEASRNVLTHGGGGQVILGGVKDHGHALVRILAMDKGPGIANVARAMADGYSTAGTMGGGLGAMHRMASTVEIFTGRTGTIVLLEIGQEAPREVLKVAGLAVPFPGERLCGDGWSVHQTAVVEIRPKEGILTYAGIGNTSAVLLTGSTSRSLVSHNGTLGVATARIQEFRNEWPADGLLILHSDGVQTRWDLSSYAGLLVRHPAVIGGALLRDFRRQRDDASVVVLKAA